GNYWFPCSKFSELHDCRAEKIYLDGTIVTPANFYWEVSPSDVFRPSTVFLFLSAVDAMAFSQSKSNGFLSNSVFIALGTNPVLEVIQVLSERFSAKFVLCFPDDFFGRLNDVRVAAFLEGYNVSVRLEGAESVFVLREKEIRIPNDQVSLSKFERAAGLDLKARTSKPRGYRTFFELLRGLQRSRKTIA